MNPLAAVRNPSDSPQDYDSDSSNNRSRRVTFHSTFTLEVGQQKDRILIFRCDHDGGAISIAKLIYSPSSAAANAKIIALHVKEQYRGHDLGGLLVSEMMLLLQSKCKRSTNEDSPQPPPPMMMITLEAEEDCTKHNKLIAFYNRLGFTVKPNVKIQFLNNNDGETYRKIPMQRTVMVPMLPTLKTSLIGTCFWPIEWYTSNWRNGVPIKLPVVQPSSTSTSSSGARHWLLLIQQNDKIQFRTTQGHYLQANNNGACTMINEEAKHDQSTLFSIHNVTDTANITKGTHFVILESSHGTFLSVTDTRTTSATPLLCCITTPTIWQVTVVDEQSMVRRFTCTLHALAWWNHCHRAWIQQTVEYVTTMRERYLTFELSQMSLKEALDQVKMIPFNDFNACLQEDVVSVRTISYYTAEHARQAGQPDWVQFVALVHQLGSVVRRIDNESSSSATTTTTRTTTESAADDDFDWTITSPSRVVGCLAPDLFREFCHWNAHGDADCSINYDSTPQGMYQLHCGLDHVMLAWTGPEYMYHMFKYNGIGIPDEGLAMLRYFVLGDTVKEYSSLTTDDDWDRQAFVAEFDSIRRLARMECTVDMSDQECDALWDDHYQYIVAKYCGNRTLCW